MLTGEPRNYLVGLDLEHMITNVFALQAAGAQRNRYPMREIRVGQIPHCPDASGN
jgi:hypothetical protein